MTRTLPLGAALPLVIFPLDWAWPAPAETVLYSFSDKDGAIPSAGLIIDSEGRLYGTTAGGSAGFGAVFKLTPPADGQTNWTATLLHSFGANDGHYPHGGLVADKEGALYGMTSSGGSADKGTVFKLKPPAAGETGWAETVLYSFNGTGGANPGAGLIAAGEGALYGTTPGGGTSGNIGTVFKLTPPRAGQTGWTETVLHSFAGQDGRQPAACLLADEEGALYGTALLGGRGGEGTIFKLVPPGAEQTQWTRTVLYDFTGGSDGGEPAAGLIAGTDGALYGTTRKGGRGGEGTIFKLVPPGAEQTRWTEIVLYNFTGGSDGGEPEAGLTAGKEGALYGTTRKGGRVGRGTVFKLLPPGAGQQQWTETVLYNFTGGSDGGDPEAGLVADKEGALYGTTANSGINGLGVVFKLVDPSGR
ncbi:MAG: hypothetical protein J2P49_04500 [Methylocapsa sp.]|nr:hypothetical protein [Methylocapsa sp.]